MKSEKRNLKSMRIQSIFAEKAKTPLESIKAAHYQQKIYFLKKWWKRIPDKEKADLLLYAWESSVYPYVTGGDEWISLFREVGYFSVCGVKKPTEEVTLYRGSEPFFKCGMSWSPSPVTALFFRERMNKEKRKKVYKITVQPEAVLAVTYDTGYKPFHHEFIEYIIDPSYIDHDGIEEYDDSQLQFISDVIRSSEAGDVTEIQAHRLIQQGIEIFQ